jgi:signal transduction histidine kinase
MPEKRVKITHLCDAGSIPGREDLLRSLLLNLGVNALKACPDSGGEVRLEAGREAEHTILSVTDNGCGIPAESIPRVTEPFYRVDKARSRATGGVGLGLALCRQIAALHGAELRIESHVGKGTRVKVIFTTP